MRKTTTALLTLALAASALARGESQDILVVSYPDFIAVDLVSKSHDMQFQVAGPDGYHSSRTFGSDSPGYFETQSADGAVLADGLYKWEAWATPKNTISREESSAMPDRNELTMTSINTGSGRVSGSFRVINGFIVDPDQAEGSTDELPLRGADQ